MISFLLIIIAFGMMFLSDLLKLSGRRGPGRNLFIAGVTALTASGVSAAMSGSRFPVSTLLRILFLLIALAAAVMEYKALFSSLPVFVTYLGDNEPSKLVDSGMYALCRHPGALWFPLFSVSLALGLGKWEMLASAGLASALNVLYVWFQDRLIFPRTITGYKQYQEDTPFIIPTVQSISCAIGRSKTSR